MSNYIFGYGSLVGASGVNGRRMKHFYTKKDFQECYLLNYERHTLSGVTNDFGKINFYGISFKLGAKTNGVIFKVKEKDFAPFLSSEGWGMYNRPYNLIDVTDLIKGVKIKGRVFTCVSRKEAMSEGVILPYYKNKVRNAILERSKKFIQEFEPKIWENNQKQLDW